METILTIDELESYRNKLGDAPCASQLQLFELIFPNGAKINKESIECHSLDVSYFLEHFAPKTLRKKIIKLKKEFYYLKNYNSGGNEKWEITYTRYNNNNSLSFWLHINFCKNIYITEAYYLPDKRLELSYYGDTDIRIANVYIIYTHKHKINTNYQIKLEFLPITRPSQQELRNISHSIKTIGDIKNIIDKYFLKSDIHSLKEVVGELPS